MGRNAGKGVCGTAESFAYYGECWANVSDVPFRKYKKYIHEGGISTPLVVHWPVGIDGTLNGSLVKEPGHVIDLMATCVDLSGASYPEEFKGQKIQAMEGMSLMPVFTGDRLPERHILFEHEGNAAIRKGDWKLVGQKVMARVLDVDLERKRISLSLKER